MALMPRRACSESGSEKTRAHLERELRRHHLYHFQDAMRGFDISGAPWDDIVGAALKRR